MHMLIYTPVDVYLYFKRYSEVKYRILFRMTDGWFLLKGTYEQVSQGTSGWEGDINPPQQVCTGNAGGSVPSGLNIDQNHAARCGFRNTFIWGNSACQIDQM